MQVYGTTGYLGEFELSSIVSEQTLVGVPGWMKHVGCAPERKKRIIRGHWR